MFTGIVRELGTVAANGGGRLSVRSRLMPRSGSSVAVNGACLTVVLRRGGALGFDVSAETLRLTNLGGLRPGDRVNLEPALKAGDELGGHLVSGHVDAAAPVLERERQRGGFLRLRVRRPESFAGLLALKGSVTVDGVSLTVTAAGRDWFESVLVPHTLKLTTLGFRKPGDPVNLEADLMARYVRTALER